MGAAVVSVAILSSCAARSVEAPQADGVIARIDGEVRKLDPIERETLCSTHLCEPNYLYSPSFGRKKPEPEPTPTPVPIFPPQPSPNPAPVPSPVPAPTSTSGPSGDPIDYSRAILRLPEAWQLTQGSREVVVAVIDTGVDADHPDLRRNLWFNEAELGGNPLSDDDRNGFLDDVFGFDFVHNRGSGLDDHKHGTHVAGIIGAEINGLGTVGVSPKVRIMPLKFLSADGVGDTANAIRAIHYAIDHGAHIISNSWGGGGYSRLLNEAIQRAVSRGILFVAAAGNESLDNGAYATYPANYDNVISVASTDETDSLSPFSNYGSRAVTIAAPGSRIFSTVPNAGWAYLSGTSMATPQVSGALALALSLDPSVDRMRLRQALCDSSRKILLDRVICGRMDVAELLSAIR